MLLNFLHQAFDAHFVGMIGYKKEIQILLLVQLPFPFILDRLHTFKLYQSLFDLIGSVASQDFETLIHPREVKSELHMA